MKIGTVAQTRNMDRRATEELGLQGDILMENAGGAVHYIISQKIGVRNKKFVVLCGSGNNAGDGLVVARKLHSDGAEVTILLMENKDRFKGEAKNNFTRISLLPIEILQATSASDLRTVILNADAVVDAIFGTGLTREVTGLYRDVIQVINESNAVTFSVDIPSGINGDTGEIMGTAVKADYTVTFGLPKIGNILYPGYAHCGELFVSHISFPPSLYNSDSITIEINNPPELPKRYDDTHKGNYGRALFIAGSSNYLGAPYFAAMSFLKSGGGLSYLAAPQSICPFIASKGAEIIFMPQTETSSGSIAGQNKEALLELARKSDIVILGPGLSLNEETQEMVRKLVPDITKPLLIDGDGITAIAPEQDMIKSRKHPTILTPHTGEMSRITKLETNDISHNRIDVLQQAASKLNAIIVLKGAHSLIGYPDKSVAINLSGNPGMATAGSGDTLTGTIAAMFCLGLPLNDAIRTGVFLHGFAGDLAAAATGQDGMTARDILERLPQAMKHLREEQAHVGQNYYQRIFTI